MLKSIGFLLGIFLFVALLSQYTDFDLFFSDLFFNTNQNQFILQGENKSLGIMLHDYPKYLFMLFGKLIYFGDDLALTFLVVWSLTERAHIPDLHYLSLAE